MTDPIILPVVLPTNGSYRNALVAAIRAMADKIEASPNIEFPKDSAIQFSGRIAHHSYDHGNQIGASLWVHFSDE